MPMVSFRVSLGSATKSNIRVRMRNFVRMRMPSCMSTFECECECFEFAFECAFECSHAHSSVFASLHGIANSTTTCITNLYLYKLHNKYYADKTLYNNMKYRLL